MCSRANCENVSCDRYSRDYGYICDDCFKELTELGVQTDIAEFMESYTRLNNKEASLAYFNEIFQ